MKNIPFSMAATVLTVALLAAPAAAFAQPQVPTREGNIWGWRDHQPTDPRVSNMQDAIAYLLGVPCEERRPNVVIADKS